MVVIVLDFKGNEIEVGTRVIFGSPYLRGSPTPEEVAFHTGEVIEISEPEGTFSEDEYGRDIASGYELNIKIRFADGSEEVTRAIGRSVAMYSDEDDIYEEIGDLEVIVDEG